MKVKDRINLNLKLKQRGGGGSIKLLVVGCRTANKSVISLYAWMHETNSNHPSIFDTCFLLYSGKAAPCRHRAKAERSLDESQLPAAAERRKLDNTKLVRRGNLHLSPIQ